MRCSRTSLTCSGSKSSADLRARFLARARLAALSMPSPRSRIPGAPQVPCSLNWAITICFALRPHSTSRSRTHWPFAAQSSVIITKASHVRPVWVQITDDMALMMQTGSPARSRCSGHRTTAFPPRSRRNTSTPTNMVRRRRIWTTLIRIRAEFRRITPTSTSSTSFWLTRTCVMISGLRP